MERVNWGAAIRAMDDACAPRRREEAVRDESIAGESKCGLFEVFEMVVVSGRDAQIR